MKLLQYLTPIRNWWWLILAATVLACISSLLVVQFRPPIYRSQTTVLVGQAINDPNPSSSEFALGRQLANTYADIAQRQTVRDAVKQDLSLGFLPEYSVRVLTSNQILEISVVDVNPQRAQAVAASLAENLVALSPAAVNAAENSARLEFVNDQLALIEQNLQTALDERSVLQVELSAATETATIESLQGQIESHDSKIATLQGNYAALLASTTEQSTNSLTVLEVAQLPTTPINANSSIVVLATLAGLLLSVGAAYLLDSLDDTLRTVEDVRDAADLATLGQIPKFGPNDGDDPLIAAAQPRSPISEAYRTLRTGVQFSNVDAKNRTVLLTSTNPSEGKSTSIANLATVLAQSGQRVLLIDGDLRRPMQHQLFNVGGSAAGLTNFLLDLDPQGENIDDILPYCAHEITQTAGLDLLPSGPIPPNPSEMLGSAKMRLALELLGERYDYVLVDTPPILMVTDAVIAARWVDTVVIVAHAGQTRSDHFREAVTRLRSANVHVAGVVLNQVPQSRSTYGYYMANDEMDVEVMSSSSNGLRSWLNGDARKSGLVRPPTKSAD